MTIEERDEVIRTLQWMHDTNFFFESVSTEEDVKYATKLAIEALEQAPKWIPVSERLPEDKQSVLVWCPQYRNIYCAYLEKEQWWIFGAFVQIVPNEVVAWMPLPEPYKTESEEKE